MKVYLSEKAQTRLAEVVERLKSGDISPLVEVAATVPDPNMPSAKWSYSNRVLAYIQTGDIDVRGYNQWLAVGRKCKPGAAFILFPKFRTTTRINSRGEEEEYKYLYGFGSGPVFGISQTELIDPNAPDPLGYQPRELPSVLVLAEKLGVPVSYGPTPGAYGTYAPDTDLIELGTHDTKVFFHELAHAAHNRVLNGKMTGGQDAHQETVAELAALVLADVYGVGDYTGNAWKYISRYNDDPVTAIASAMTDVGRVLQIIFGDETDDKDTEN